MLEALETLLKEQGYFYTSGEYALALKNIILSSGLGELMPQYPTNETEYNIRLSTGKTLQESSTSVGRYSVPPHTDGAHLDRPPRLMALYCVEHDINQSVETWVTSVEDIFSDISEEDLSLIHFNKSSRPFKFSYNTHVRGHVDFESLTQEKLLGYDAALTSRQKEVVCKFLASYETHATKFRLKKGEILIWNNMKIIHSREGVSDNCRHLLRYWIS